MRLTRINPHHASTEHVLSVAAEMKALCRCLSALHCYHVAPKHQHSIL